VSRQVPSYPVMQYCAGVKSGPTFSLAAERRLEGVSCCSTGTWMAIGQQRSFHCNEAIYGGQTCLPYVSMYLVPTSSQFCKLLQGPLLEITDAMPRQLSILLPSLILVSS
jgi:hypothetical protein